MINCKNIYLVLSIIIFIGIVTILLINRNSKESFDVIIGDKKRGNVKIIDLEDFFNFLEYYMVIDMDPRTSDFGYQPVCTRKGQSIKIANNIRNLLQMLHFVIYNNDKDNFYHRFLVTKVGSNLQSAMRSPIRKLNYDEMVRDKIGKKFTFLKSNEYDKYWPRANLDSEHQYPLPYSINVRNYYTEENTEINLLALKMLIDIVQHKNRTYFDQIIRPTEHIAFGKEFMVPMISIINSILSIINTNIYKDYIHKHKFKVKYQNTINDQYRVHYY